MRLLLHVPDAALGTRYPMTLQLGTGAGSQTVQIEIMIADMHYLPVVRQ